MIDLNAICDKLTEDDLHEACDSTCTSGFDNDGSTGFDVFGNGMRLGRKLEANPRAQLFMYRRETPGCVWFFIYENETDLEKKLQAQITTDAT